VSGHEAVWFDISARLAGFSGFTINAGSATDREKLGVFASNAAGIALGAKLADITITDGNVIKRNEGNKNIDSNRDDRNGLYRQVELGLWRPDRQLGRSDR
jgi:hypothetical protein